MIVFKTNKKASTKKCFGLVTFFKFIKRVFFFSHRGVLNIKKYCVIQVLFYVRIIYIHDVLKILKVRILIDEFNITTSFNHGAAKIQADHQSLKEGTLSWNQNHFLVIGVQLKYSAYLMPNLSQRQANFLWYLECYCNVQLIDKGNSVPYLFCPCNFFCKYTNSRYLFLSKIENWP